MKKFLIGFVLVVVGLALGVGAAFGAATVISKVAAQRLAAGAAPAQSFRLNRNGTNRMGPGNGRNGMPGLPNRAPFNRQNGPNWGQRKGMPGPNWNGNRNGQNGQNGQNNQSGQNGGSPNMGPGGRGAWPNSRMWPHR